MGDSLLINFFIRNRLAPLSGSEDELSDQSDGEKFTAFEPAERAATSSMGCLASPSKAGEFSPNSFWVTTS